MMSSNDEERLEQWRDTWMEVAKVGCTKITKDMAITHLKNNAQGPISNELAKSLRAQMDVNADGLIDFHEFARACEKLRVAD